jgi:hypothetical protein
MKTKSNMLSNTLLSKNKSVRGRYGTVDVETITRRYGTAVNFILTKFVETFLMPVAGGSIPSKIYESSGLNPCNFLVFTHLD